MTMHFSVAEFGCKCGCGRNLIDADFVIKLNTAFLEIRFPIPVTSGYRCPEHNQKVSSTGANGPHTTGHAADLGVRGAQALELLTIATACGMFSGIGLNQKGEGRFLHLDDLKNAPGQPRPHCWTY